MAVFYANFNNILDENTWRVLAVFASRFVADEWWEAVSSGSNAILADNIQRISPQHYTHKPDLCNVLYFFTDSRFEAVSSKFRGRMFLTLENDRGGRGVDTLPPQNDIVEDPSREDPPGAPVGSGSHQPQQTHPPKRPTHPHKSPTHSPSPPTHPTQPHRHLPGEIPNHIKTVKELMEYLSSHHDPSDRPPPRVSEAPSEGYSVASSLHALIIGIADYREKDTGGWKPLRGTIGDAMAVKAYLVEDLGVPDTEDRIQLLLNGDATRDKIQNAIRALKDASSIKKHDPILIYYSGHGTQAMPPDDWPVLEKEGLIQMLAPYDVIHKKAQDKFNRAHGVVDIMLNMLLSELATEKGNNITVIFDSCHSASATRDREDELDNDSRNFDIPEDTPVDFDVPRDLPLEEETPSLAPSMDSHVILSACRHDEKSREPYDYQLRAYRGRFTVALLKLLKEQGFNRLTYNDVISFIRPFEPDHPTRRQNPQCEGTHRNRIMFHPSAVGRRNVRHVTGTTRSGFTLQAGEADGVTPGTEYAIYSDHQLAHQIGTMTVQATKAFTSQMVPHPPSSSIDLPQNQGYAVKVRFGQHPDVKVYVPVDGRLISLWHTIYEHVAQRTELGEIIIDYVDDREKESADLVLDVTEDKHVTFSILSMGTASSERLVLPQRVRIGDPTSIYAVLHSAAHFGYHLRRTASKHELRSPDRIVVECNRLIGGRWESKDILGPREFVPASVGDNLIRQDETLVVYERETAGEDQYYAFRLFNKTPVDLFVNIFSFNLDTLEIKEVYSHSMGHNAARAEASLAGKVGSDPGSLVIGYGSSGRGPRHFSVTPGTESCHLVCKIFLSTQAIDLSGIPQESPFGDSPKGEQEVTPPRLEVWDTISIPIRVERQELNA